MFSCIPSSGTFASDCVMLTAKKLGRLARSALVELLLGFQERVAKLEQRLKELEGCLAKNSSNSHHPPSSDALSKPLPKSLRSRSARKAGGQPGHPGQTLQRIKNPDHIRIHGLEVCPQCQGCAVSKEPVLDYESRQVFDLPEPALVVYGPRFQSLMVYLNQQQLLPYGPSIGPKS